MPAPLELTDDLVLGRTPAGQQAAVAGTHDLDEAHRRMLLLVNGFTPLALLAQRLPWGDNAPRTVQTLIDKGLVSQVSPGEPDYAATVSPAFI